MATLIERAVALATEAHAGQVRKTESVPYITHPVAVALLLSRYGFSDTIIAAALVHDVLEDTAITEAELRQVLGDDVTDIVRTLSEDTSLSWEERKQRYIAQVSAAGEAVWAVSTADKVHNLQNLLASHARDGEAVWARFNRGKEQKLWFEEALLEALRARWAHSLLEEYRMLVAALRTLV